MGTRERALHGEVETGAIEDDSAFERERQDVREEERAAAEEREEREAEDVETDDGDARRAVHADLALAEDGGGGAGHAGIMACDRDLRGEEAGRYVAEAVMWEAR